MLVKGESGIEAEILLGTSNPHGGVPIYTFRLVMHRYVVEQFLKHRAFSNCANSSRAMTVPKMNEKITKNMAVPLYWGAQTKGMQPKEDVNKPVGALEYWWISKATESMNNAKLLWDGGLHQQIPNRLTHAFQMAEYITTATDFENFFNLRLKDNNAQAEINELARCMFEAKQAYQLREPRQGWHLPYVSDQDLVDYGLEGCLKLSAARCATISYDNHRTGKPMTIESAEKIYKHLLDDTNPHYTPLEMQARVLFAYESHMIDFIVKHLERRANFWNSDVELYRLVKKLNYFGNLNGWKSQRYIKESEYISSHK